VIPAPLNLFSTIEALAFMWLYSCIIQLAPNGFTTQIEQCRVIGFATWIEWFCDADQMGLHLELNSFAMQIEWLCKADRIWFCNADRMVLQCGSNGIATYIEHLAAQWVEWFWKHIFILFLTVVCGTMVHRSKYMHRTVPALIHVPPCLNSSPPYHSGTNYSGCKTTRSVL